MRVCTPPPGDRRPSPRRACAPLPVPVASPPGDKPAVSARTRKRIARPRRTRPQVNARCERSTSGRPSGADRIGSPSARSGIGRYQATLDDCAPGGLERIARPARSRPDCDRPRAADTSLAAPGCARDGRRAPENRSGAWSSLRIPRTRRRWRTRPNRIRRRS